MPSESVQKPISNSVHKSETRHTFYTLPKRSSEQHNHPPEVEVPHHSTKYVADEMKAPEPIPPKLVRMHSTSSAQPVDYALKETSPFLGGGRVVGGRVIRTDRAGAGTYDLVEKMHFLFVRVVKARELPAMDVTGSLDPYVEVRIGNYKGVTKHIEKNQHPVWNVVFAFSRERMQASVLEVVVKDKDLVKDDYVGFVRFDLNEVPMRVPPDSPLARNDEAFPDAWHSDAATPIDSSAAASALIRSKVYHAPRLWYVRCNVVEAQDLIPSEKTRFPDAYVKAQIGNQVMRTKPIQSRNFNPVWNEDLFFCCC
ncbi:UNVERIFIED_CONTAM: FT-interacting protein 7 [Sesamum radiatum]|uniref:FT-interacting protein 7 n=1 Tax=Sesamum radiatum TaxID=300843 RepID=A0AAW2MGL1_SESRA